MLCAREDFRLCTMMLIEEIVESLCVQTPIIIQDMCILLCDHRSLCMAGVTLNGFDITAVQLRFLYKGIIIKHNKTEPTYTKTSLFLCEKRRFFMARTEKGVVATI